MPNPPSYETRTMMALRDIARASLDVVAFDELVHRVETQIQEDGLLVGPRCRQKVRKAVAQLARSRKQRVRIRREGGSTDIQLTPDGVKEFKTFGTTPIDEGESPRLKRMSQTQIEKELEVLKDICDKIQEVFREVKPGSSAANDPNDLVDEVRESMENVKLLGEQGTALYASVSENSNRERYLKGLLRESMNAAVNEAGPSSRVA